MRGHQMADSTAIVTKAITTNSPRGRVMAHGIPRRMGLDVVIGLGANLGDRQENLEKAVLLLAQLGVIEAVSSLYESDSVGATGPKYLNAAVRLSSRADDPHALLSELAKIETLLGRERRERWGPRTLDLDLLWIHGRALETPRLTVPHPRLIGRSFALVPLVEVAPDAQHPNTGKRYSELDRGSPELERLADPSWCRAMRFPD
jgi:2-amino-4-hydroxy-6-hydroxymethyldihydropteridine diphosphokinase